MTYSEYILENEIVTFDQILNLMEDLMKIDNLEQYIEDFEAIIKNENEISTFDHEVDKTADEIRNTQEYSEIEKFTNKNMNALEFAKNSVGENDEEKLKKETTYMYISHYIDRKLLYNHNDPFDDPHFAKYLTRNDRANYDIFLNNIRISETLDGAYDIFKFAMGAYDIITSGKARVKDFSDSSSEILETSEKIKDYVNPDNIPFIVDEGLDLAIVIKDVIEIIVGEMEKGTPTEELIKHFEETVVGKHVIDDAKKIVAYIIKMIVAIGVVVVFTVGAPVIAAVAMGLVIFYGKQIVGTAMDITFHAVMTLFDKASILSLLQTLSMRMGFRFYLVLYGEDYS